MSGQPEQTKQQCRDKTWAIQERLDGLLSTDQEQALTAHLDDCPSCQNDAEAFEGLHLSLAQPELGPPAGLHEQIIASVGLLRRRERLYRRFALALLALVTGAVLWFFQDALLITAGVLSATPGELSESLQLSQRLQNLSGGLSVNTPDLSLPLTLLLLLPLFFGVNVMALRERELRHA